MKQNDMKQPEHTRAEKTTDLPQVTDKLYHNLCTPLPDRDSNSQYQW